MVRTRLAAVVLAIVIIYLLSPYAFRSKIIQKQDNIMGGTTSDQDELLLSPPGGKKSRIRSVSKKGRCTMQTCFDFSKCIGNFKLYVYPQNNTSLSINYANILQAVRRSRYYTDNPNEACIFLPNLDPTDRDRLSSDFHENLEKQLKALPHWNNGQNHIIFNIYSGTWPHYKDTLDIDVGKAILAKASVSSRSFRANFDISLPLFSKTHPQNAAGHLPSSNNIFPSRRKYLVSFKGKRYLKGIGSEARSAFYKLHNGKDMILLTTCKHGNNWRQVQDQRCSDDDELYERYDYHEILRNSTFCLVPRGRRLGSFRFLESLSVSCVPVSLANGYELPFAEVIDWNKALVNVDERRLLEIGLILKGKSVENIALYKQQNQFLWEAYFSSVEKIVFTVIEIMRQRVMTKPHLFSHKVWNTFPGALVSLATQNNTSLHPIPNYASSETFTVVLLVKIGKVNLVKKVLELAKNVSKSKYFEKLVVIWAVDESVPESSFWPSKTVITRVKGKAFQNHSWKSQVITDAILMVDNFASVSPEEVDLGFSVWQAFPNRVTGIHARSHFWNVKRSQWSYTTKIGEHTNNGYSIILLSTAFYHRYYDQLYTEFFPKHIQNKILSYDSCFDISLNFLVAHVTRLPPIKILHYDPIRTKLGTPPVMYSVENACFQLMAESFGYVPLLYSGIAFVVDHVVL